MQTIGKYIKVKELQKDFTIDGLLEKYDDSSPFMFGLVVDGNEDIMNKLSTYGNYGEKVIISFKRVAKIPYLGQYLVSFEDIIDVMTESEFNKL